HRSHGHWHARPARVRTLDDGQRCRAGGSNGPLPGAHRSFTAARVRNPGCGPHREAAMMALKKVLVATDFEPASESALRYGRVLARSFGAELHVLHIV